MEEYKNKSKQELLKVARDLADEHEAMKVIIKKMLDELDQIELRQKSVIDIIKMN